MIRIGTGYDLHRLVPGRPLVIGGVAIPFGKGPDAHSDGDVVAHAVIDGMLGAACLGNIGQMFPDSDPAFKDADSMVLLAKAFDAVKKAGFALVNLDATVVLEAPKLNPHIDSIRRRLAECLAIGEDRISVKAKSNEGVGPEGRGEAISAQAAVLLESRGA